MSCSHRRLVAPSGIPENVPKLVVPARGTAHIMEHIGPFVKSNPQGIVAVNVLGQAEAGLIVGVFGLERAEKSIPDDKYASMVAVNVFGIASVMNAVVRRGVEYEFEWAYRMDQFGMNPELVKKTDRTNRHDHGWGEADDWHPQPKDEAHEATRPGLPERGG